MSKGRDTYISQYHNILHLGDLNVESSDQVLNDFRNIYNLFSLVKELAGFQISYHPSCIDLFLTIRPRGFHHTVTTETVYQISIKWSLRFQKFKKKKKQKSKLFNTETIKALKIKCFKDN